MTHPFKIGDLVQVRTADELRDSGFPALAGSLFAEEHAGQQAKVLDVRTNESSEAPMIRASIPGWVGGMEDWFYAARFKAVQAEPESSYKVGDVVEIVSLAEFRRAAEHSPGVFCGLNFQDNRAGTHIKVLDVQVNRGRPMILAVVPGWGDSDGVWLYEARVKPVTPAPISLRHLVVGHLAEASEVLSDILGPARGDIYGVLRSEDREPRPYDFNRGDIRRYDLNAALKVAEDAARERGKDMTIRWDLPAIHRGTPLLLIQEA